MPAARQKFVIVDGNALIHRAFHALPPTMHTKTVAVPELDLGAHHYARLKKSVLAELKK